MIDPIQQQLVDARKNQILEAAAAVFAQKGFHPTTTKDIAKQAGISEGTIYNYFESKTALLLGIFERMKDTVIQENMPIMPEDGDFRTLLRGFLYQPLMALKQNNFALFRIVVSEMMVNEELRVAYNQQILEPTLALAEMTIGSEMVKQGISPLQASLTIRAVSSMILGLMIEYIMGDTLLVEHWDELPDVLTDLILNALKLNPS
ncbi:MAG: TetR/AcrR family transcriptional regulator [Anaerolineae bacterium]|nr:TetR/AcrR family transcriptional regulator [Anaerolineae bacterium]